MYAAFGNKEEWFGKALKRYTGGPATYGVRALAMSTAKAVASTAPSRPPPVLAIPRDARGFKVASLPEPPQKPPGRPFGPVQFTAHDTRSLLNKAGVASAPSAELRDDLGASPDR
jgi:hypothetical protein